MVAVRPIAPIHLPVQAADYWLRVRRHPELAEFGTYGYFPGIEIQQAPPLVYPNSVAPRSPAALQQFLERPRVSTGRTLRPQAPND